jgi:hypothetical protein
VEVVMSAPAQTERLEERFEDFWSAYPHKTGYAGARQLFMELAPRRADVIVAAAREYEGDLPPTTWLYEGRWKEWLYS